MNKINGGKDPLMKKCLGKLALELAAVLLGTMCATAPSRADVIFSGSGVSGNTNNTVSAQVTFSVLPGNVLEVVLENTSPNPEAIRRGDILTGVIWDMKGTDPALSGLATSLTAGSNIYTNANTINNATSLVNKWAFKGMPGGPYTYSNNSATFEYGISTIGGGVFPGGSVHGDDYGLVANAGSLDNPSFSASAFPLIVNTLTFNLNGFTSSLDNIENVKFTYGSGPNFVLPGPKNTVPEPSSFVLAGIGMTLGALGWHRRRKLSRAS